MTENTARRLEILGVAFQVKEHGELPEKMHMHLDAGFPANELRDRPREGDLRPLVTFVIGNTNLLDNVSLFSPGNSITSALANEFAEASPGLHTSALIELGLVLFVITFLVLAASKLLLMRLQAHEGTRS